MKKHYRADYLRTYPSSFLYAADKLEICGEVCSKYQSLVDSFLRMETDQSGSHVDNLNAIFEARDHVIKEYDKWKEHIDSRWPGLREQYWEDEDEGTEEWAKEQGDE